RQHERDEGAGDGRGARAAIGLDDVAVEPDGALAELLEPHDGAERPADEPLDLLRPPADLPRRRLPAGPRRRRARQHAVLGRDPPLAGAPEELRHAVLDARGADDARAPRLDEHGTLGGHVDVRGDGDGTKRGWGAVVGTHRRSIVAEACPIADFGLRIADLLRIGRPLIPWPPNCGFFSDWRACVSPGKRALRILAECARAQRTRIAERIADRS